MGKNINQWVEEERPAAEQRLKVDLVLGEYAKRQELEPSDEDVVSFLEEQAGQDDELKGQVEELKKSPSARRYFASRLRRRRVLDRLAEGAGAPASPAGRGGCAGPGPRRPRRITGGESPLTSHSD